MTMGCLAVDCRFCKYERERDGIASSSPSESEGKSEVDTYPERPTTPTIYLSSAERERDGTTSSPSSSSLPPDGSRFDMNAMASSLVSSSRRDSLMSHRPENMAGAYEHYAGYGCPTARPGTLDIRLKNSEVIDDAEMKDIDQHDDIDLPSPTSSSVYSNDNPLPYPLHSSLCTQSESGIPDNDEDNTSFNFLDEVLLDLDAWLVAGELEMDGLHDNMTEEEYAEYKEWYKAVVGGVARGMVERGVMGPERRRRSV